MRTGLAIVLGLMLLALGASAQKGGARPPSPCKHWKAWQDLQPGTNPPTLHVTASCEFPTAGYTVELVPVQTKKAETHPENYVLRRVVHKPDGMAAQVITELPLDYKVETSTEYKEVRIRPDKVRVRVKKVQ
ncbi:MAG TPA: hypothetical protein VFA40_26075 [Terriglobales bacterium]|nr:hypothetical protein [Terriglobales bacterium]